MHGGKNYLSIAVPRDSARNDITIEIQVGGTLQNPWTTVATSTNGGPFIGPGYLSGEDGTPGIKLITIRDTTALEDASRRFMRAQVTKSIP